MNKIENNIMQTNVNTIGNDTINKQKEIPENIKRRFEVEIYDEVINDSSDIVRLEKVKYNKPVIIEASSQKDLQDFAEKLKLCQQTFKIVRALDDIPNKQNTQYHQQINQPLINQPPIKQQDILVQENTVIQQIVKEQKPKYYTVGDIEIKNDNGKIYQKQWIKLTEQEASNFRVINTKSNSIFKLNDRHIEMKKWILVDSVDKTSDLED